jgi:hypothetical protein
MLVDMFCYSFSRHKHTCTCKHVCSGVIFFILRWQQMISAVVSRLFELSGPCYLLTDHGRRPNRARMSARFMLPGSQGHLSSCDASCWLRKFDMFPQLVAIPDASTACLHRNMGKPAVDTPVPVSSGHHTWDSDPLSGALDLRDHSLPFLRRTAVADEHHRTLVSSDPFQGAR